MRSLIVLMAIFLGGGLHAQNPTLTITPGAGSLRLNLRGQVGAEHMLEASSNLSSTNAWNEVITFTPASTNETWTDSGMAAFPMGRFYRLVRPAAARAPFFATNFRLMDHTDRSRELDYFNNYRAVALVFSGVGCTNSQASVTLVKALRDQFEPQGVRFFYVNASPQDSRPAIAAQAALLGIDLPVLKDDGQVLARDLSATQTTEAFCFDAADWHLFYRGAMDDRPSFSQPVLPTTQHYLSNALARFLAGGVVSPSRTVAQGCSLTVATVTNASYVAAVAPILQAKCIRCHSPGNIGSWAMTNHAVVAQHALAIKNEVMARRMPPWHADPQYGTFTNDNSLTPGEMAALLQWINDGAPRGSGTDPLPAASSPTNGISTSWPVALGTPDAILRLPTPQSIPASGVVAYRYVNVANTLTQDKWLRAAVVRPGNRRVVHHCLVYFGTNSFFNGADGFFAGYVPGSEPVAFPPGTGKFLPRSTTLTFQMHYTTTGQVETDQTELGLYFESSAPAAELQTKSAFDLNSFGIDGYYSIPPGVTDYPAITASFTPSSTRDVWLYEMSPHMHYRGARFKYEAVYPNGSREVLLSVPKYDFHWQTLYRLAQPKRLPAGTRIECSGAFDNSSQNRDNPDPGATVVFDDQTTDEMFIGYLNFSLIP